MPAVERVLLQIRFKSNNRLIGHCSNLLGEMKRAIAREEQDRRNQDRFASTLVIAASIIAAVRLAPDEIGRPSHRLTATIMESVGLARAVLNAVLR